LLDRTAARRLRLGTGRRPVVVGASRRVRASRSAIVSLRLDRSARRRLMRVRSVGLSVTIRAVAGAGGTATRTERVVLSRAGG
jgi:hypothetical protein